MSIERAFRSARAGCLIVGLTAAGSVPLAAQDVELRRDVPPLRPYECPAGAAVPAVPPADAREAERLATAATHAAVRGDPAEARGLLARAAEIDPAAGTVAFQFARILEELGEVQPAVREYCRFVNLAGDSPEARETREYLRQIGPRVRPGIPDAAVARFGEALRAYDEARLEEADRALDAVIAAAPQWATPYYDRGIVRAGLGQRDASLADFERFLALEPAAAERDRVTRWMGEIRATTGVRYNAATAFALGLLPGAGHYYTDRPIMGTFLLVVAGGAVGAGIAHTVTHVDCLGIPQDGVCPPGQILDQRDERPLLMPGLAVAAAASVLGAIDAALGARRRNALPPVIRLSGDAGGISVLPPAGRARGARIDLAWIRLAF